MFPAAVLVGIQSLGMGLGHHEFKAHETGMQPRNLNLCCCWANILHYNTLHIDYDLRGVSINASFVYFNLIFKLVRVSLLVPISCFSASLAPSTLIVVVESS